MPRFTDLNDASHIVFQKAIPEFQKLWPEAKNVALQAYDQKNESSHNTWINIQCDQLIFGQGERVSLAAICLREFPGCCGIAVLYHLAVQGQPSSIRLPTYERMLELAEQAALAAGYSMLMYTTAEQKGIEEALVARDFNETNPFNSQRTGASIKIWVKTIANRFGAIKSTPVVVIPQAPTGEAAA